MKNHKRLAEFMTLMADIHEKEISKAKIEYYFHVLEPFTDEECEKAFKKIGLKWFPKPQDFIDVLKGTTEDKGIQAWQKVMDTLSRGGKSADDYSTDKAVIALGGWDYMAQQTYDELKWTEKRFLEHFEVIESRKDFEVLDYHGEEQKLLDQVQNYHEITAEDVKEIKPIALALRRKGKTNKEIQEFVRNHFAKKNKDLGLVSVGDIIKSKID